MDLDARVRRLQERLENSKAIEELVTDPGSAGGYDDQHDGKGAPKQRGITSACKSDWEIMGH